MGEYYLGTANVAIATRQESNAYFGLMRSWLYDDFKDEIFKGHTMNGNIKLHVICVNLSENTHDISNIPIILLFIL